MPNRFLLVRDTGMVTLSTVVQQIPDVIVKPLGHIVGITFSVSCSLSGSLVSPKYIPNALNEVKILDSSQQVIYDIQGVDIPYLDYLTDRLGTFSGLLGITNSLQTQNWTIYLPIALKDQPITIQLFLEAYSNLASSGATGGSTQVKVGVWYSNEVEPTTGRIIRFDAPLSSGDNDLSSRLAKNLFEIGLVIRDISGTDSNINTITFRSTGTTEIEQEYVGAFISRDNDEFASGHTVGFFNLRTTPHIINDASVLIINASNPTTIRVYQIYRR